MSKRTNSHTLSHAENIFSGDAYQAGAEGNGRGIPRASLVQVDLGAPIVADVNGLFSEDSGGVGPFPFDFTLDGALVTAGVAIFDVPRGVQIVNAGASTSKLTFYGTDKYGVEISEEVLSDGTTIVFGKKAFKTITRVATDTDTTAAVTVGSSDILGLPFRLENVADVVVIDENDQNLYQVTARTAAAAAAATAAAAALTASATGALTGVAITVTGVPPVITYSANTPTPSDTQTIADGTVPTVAELGQFTADQEDYNTEVKADLDAIKVFQDQVVVDDAAQKVVIDQNVVDVAAQKVELDKLITDVEAIRVEVNKLVTDVGAVDTGTLVKSDATAATDVTGDVRGTYNPTAVLDGTKNFKLTFKPQARNTVGAYGVAQFRKAT